MKRLALTAAVSLAALLPMPAGAHVGCHSKRCVKRVQVKAAHAKWRTAVRAYGVGLLRARMRCESGNHGGYRLATTGNGFWFAHQFEPRAWFGAGGRSRGGRPSGVWTRQPSRLEQDYRAVRWAHLHGGDPWPNCP
jgi:hypothetical protein